MDAKLIRDFVGKHRSELRVWKPEAAITRELRMLTEDRRKTVDDRTALTHELAHALKQYFPQALAWFGGESAPLLHAAMGEWPTLGTLKRMRRTTLEKLIRAHTRRWSDEKIDALFEEMFMRSRCRARVALKVNGGNQSRSGRRGAAAVRSAREGRVTRA